MKISFDTIAESAIENFKGGEGTFHVHLLMYDKEAIEV